MRYSYRQVAYQDPDEKSKPLEWADEYLHYACRWLIYALWDGRGREPCLSPWIPPLVRELGRETVEGLGPSTKKTHLARGEEEEIPGWGELSDEDKERVLKWLRLRGKKPTRIRRLWINKQMYPFEAEPPWGAKEWLHCYTRLYAGPKGERDEL